MSHQIGIIIINYNNWADTQKVLTKLNASNYQSFWVFLVDNASSNQNRLKIKLKQLSLNYPVKLQLNRQNLGFAKAVNQGLKFFHKKGFKYYLLLNNDTWFDNNFISCLVKTYQNLPPGSILSPIIKHRVKTKTLYGGEGFITPWLALARHVNYTQPPNLLRPKPVDFVSGCCMFFDKTILNLGIFFNPIYFLYLEDVDFCLKAKKYGSNCYLTSNCIIYHKQSRSFKKATDKLKYSFISNLKFAWLNFKLYLPVWIIFLPLFYLRLYLLWSLTNRPKA